ncbi:MAG: DUF2505 domain-containing protein [Mycobacterium sp.]|nr:DUF2505 domain-containing protein [Mycobacterium sp.]MBV8346556.1 DUF2505 domain-containing protein [Mycolicibacterium sp.]
MPRTFDMVADYPDSVEDLLQVFGDERYWLAWLAEYGPNEATLDSIRVGANGSVEVACTQTLPHDRLPAVVTRVYKGDLQIKREESWSALTDGETTCAITADMPGTPVTLSGTAQLTPDPAGADGAQLRVQGSVEVRIPVIGRQIEKVIANQLMDLATTRRHFTSSWIDQKS